MAADGKGDFKVDQNISAMANNLIDDHAHDMAYVMRHLTVNGNTADAFKVVWDALDARYNAQGYYNDVTNEQFIRLGVEYAKYLEADGKELSFTVAKYTADGLDPGSTADRLQSMHDNLLGNATFYNIEN